MKLIEFFGVSNALSDMLDPKNVELVEDGCSDVADIGDTWKSAKSSSSNDAIFELEDWGRPEEEAGGGGRAYGDNVEAVRGCTGGACIVALAAFAAASVRGDFAIGEGTGGDNWSTGDWKSENSSSPKRLDVTVGDTPLVLWPGGRKSEAFEGGGNALASGVFPTGDAAGKSAGLSNRKACEEACGGVLGAARCGYNSLSGSEEVGDAGEVSAAVSYEADEVEEADIGPESTCDSTWGGRGNGEESLGFALATEGAIGLKDGGGGSPKPVGGVEACGRGGGELDVEDIRATVGRKGPTPPDPLAGVKGRDGTRGGANGGIEGGPGMGGVDALGVVIAVVELR